MTERWLQITSAAKTDLREASSWYESEQAGLGERFLTAIEQAFSTIEGHPLVGEAIDDFTRGFPTIGFPYRVYYSVDESRFEVVAVLHTSRDPNTFRARNRSR